MRDTTPAGRYGIEDLSPEGRLIVKTDTLLAVRTAILCMILHKQKNSFIVESPVWIKEQVSIFMLDEFQAVLNLAGVRTRTFVQCPTGSYSEKATTLLYFGDAASK